MDGREIGDEDDEERIKNWLMERIGRKKEVFLCLKRVQFGGSGCGWME